jgi:hypothetical protein
MFRHIVRFGWVFMLSTLLGSCGGAGNIVLQIGSGQIVDDADYTLNSVSFSGPSQLSNNAQATYTVTFTFTVNSPGGIVSPFVILGDDDGGLRFDNDLLVLEQHSEANPGPGTFTRSLAMDLKCDGDILVGVPASRFSETGSSGEGDFEVFQVDEAEVFARVQRGARNPTQVVDSAIMDVACE